MATQTAVPAKRRITIDPITRLEGHGRIEIFLDDAGGVERAFPGERRILVPSPREVATYDKKPQMSAPEVTDKLIAELDTGELDFVVVNYANADMVGHSGVLAAAVADYRPTAALAAKRPKSTERWALELEPTIDIARLLGEHGVDPPRAARRGAPAGWSPASRHRFSMAPSRCSASPHRTRGVWTRGARGGRSGARHERGRRYGVIQFKKQREAQ